MKKYISWNQFQIMAESLEKKINHSKKEFDGIYGIPRGGLVLGVCLSHRLSLPLLEKPETNILIVDDISDMGNTLQNYKFGKYRNCTIATLYSTTWTKVIPDFFVNYKKSQDEWLVFPWENLNEKEEKDNL
ncbi:MAG: phosphoribosyltransferase [Nanoarchaeota archaeon]|nr:phosphoribosyltransferase [Nanoarchaeota archaeon]